MMKVLQISLILLLILSASFRSIQAQSEPLVIVASFSILADVARNVAGDDVVVDSLVPVNADPHSFQPAARDLTQLAQADIVLINGAGFEQNLLDIIENAGEDVNILVASQCVEILAFGDEDHEDEQAQDHEHEGELAQQCESHHAELEELGIEAAEDGNYLGYLYETECGVHEHEETEEHTGCDPHVWQDPHNVMLWTLFIRDALIKIDPDNADIYTANADDYLQKLAALDAELHAIVETIPAERRIIVTNHDNLSYLAHAYGFEIAATVIPAASTLAEPSARDVAALIDLIREQNIQAIFAENTVNPGLAEQVASETGAAFYLLYTDSLSEGDPAGTYLDYMRYSMSTIVGALSE